MPLKASPDEIRRRSEVVDALLKAIESGTTIKLPPFDRDQDRPSDTYAMLTVGETPNPFGGTLGDYRYQFEGEDDLLHLMVTRVDRGELTPEEGRGVAEWLFQGVPPALIWFKPGQLSQHFYVGHDDLVGAIAP